VDPFSTQTKVQEQFCIETHADPCGLVLFGASGDLAERKLFPSLHHLHVTGLLPAPFYVVGVGRTAYSDDAFRDRVRESLRKFRPGADHDPRFGAFLGMFHYVTLDYASSDGYTTLAAQLAALDNKHHTGGNRLFYLSVPPSLYAVVGDHLAAAGLHREHAEELGWSRLIVEKPFGRDLASAQDLSRALYRHFNEPQIYRIDHYLGKETVQNMLVLRFANLLFEPLWNRNYIDHVQITVAEDIGIGHRAGYYEQAGVLRDMFQNHLLQLLCITAMEPPATFDADRVRDQKSALLREVRPLAAHGADFLAVRGQYSEGEVGGEKVPGYRKERGVAPDSATDTFAALTLFVDNWRWQGVPFYLRSGKRLAERRTEIAVQFKPVPHLLFAPLRPQDILPNVLVMRIQPREGLSLLMETKHPGPKLCMSAVTMDFSYEHSFGALPEAYERLLIDAMSGDQTLFIRADWVNMSWNLLDPLLDRWQDAPPALYPAGSWGPAASDQMLAARGHLWRNP
jgi:glucose-6-phosphate 1-dehydrogenase